MAECKARHHVLMTLVALQVGPSGGIKYVHLYILVYVHAQRDRPLDYCEKGSAVVALHDLQMLRSPVKSSH